jgi:hypothetical protein
VKNPDEEAPGYWLLPKDLSHLHDEVIEYCVLVRITAARKQEEMPHFPLTHSALFTMHLRAILIHRGVRTLCEFGWTPVVPILLRTLLDIIASCHALTVDEKNSEYMGFKYLGTSLIQFLLDPAITPEQQQQNREQVEKLLSTLTPEDRRRAEQYIVGFTKPPAYWYNPEQASPAKILSTASPELQQAYRALSGSTHGGFIGSALFDDTPDAAQINPREHPRRTRSAIVMSSRLLLEITYIRDVVEAIGSTDYYKHIINDLFLPLQATVGQE